MNDTIKFYNTNAKTFFDATLHTDISSLYKPFLEYLNPGANILDLGCGSGRDSKYFIEQGYQVVAVDGSEELCKLASEYIGQPVVCKLFSEIDYQDQFDGIWACSSLLHVPIDELPHIFNKLYTALKHNGYLYPSFKYGEFEGKRNERYFTDLTEDAFNKIINKTNKFKIIKIFNTFDVRPEREGEKWLNALIQKI